MLSAFNKIADITQQQEEEEGGNEIKIRMDQLAFLLHSFPLQQDGKLLSGGHHFGCLPSAMSLLQTPASPGERQGALGSTKAFPMPGKLQGL